MIRGTEAVKRNPSFFVHSQKANPYMISPSIIAGANAHEKNISKNRWDLAKGVTLWGNEAFPQKSK
jgi:hypothetical protein